MSHQQLITIVSLQLIAVLSVGWYLVADRTNSSEADEVPPNSMIPAAPTMAPPLDWEPEESSDGIEEPAFDQEYEYMEDELYYEDELPDNLYEEGEPNNR